jgi:hypothetical protein
MTIKILDLSAWIFDPETGEPIKQIETRRGPFNSRRILPPVTTVELEDKPPVK